MAGVIDNVSTRRGTDTFPAIINGQMHTEV